MAADKVFPLVQDRKGMLWDLLLYVPTVGALALFGAKLWFGADRTWSYVLFFMASYFFIVGANRILMTRLMALPKAPIRLALAKDTVSLQLKSGATCALVKDVRYFSDYANRSFGLSGLDGNGKRHQYVLHRGQFADAKVYQDLQSRLKIYK